MHKYSGQASTETFVTSNPPSPVQRTFRRNLSSFEKEYVRAEQLSDPACLGELQPYNQMLPALASAEPAAKSNFRQLLAGMAQALLPGQMARLTITTIEIFGGQAGRFTSGHSDPVGPQTVLRALSAAEQAGKLGDCEWNYHRLDLRSLPDGTTMLVLLDSKTGFKHGWTVCPRTYEPKHLGWVND